MTDEIAELEERIAAREAYGIWNLAQDYNRLAALRRREASPVRRLASDIAEVAMLAVLLVLGYTPFLLSLLWLLGAIPGI